jgi:hypothetical protein
MLSDQFSRIFRDEHRQIRDELLALIQAFQDRDKTRIGALLNQVAADTGPHFRYEEESLYPALVEIFGPDYIDELFRDHDRAIGTAQRLIQIAGQATIRDEDVAEATRLVRSILPHVSDCDGLSIMVERLPEGKVRTILETRDHSREAGLNLLQWTEQVRNRSVVSPQTL